MRRLARWSLGGVCAALFVLVLSGCRSGLREGAPPEPVVQSKPQAEAPGADRAVVRDSVAAAASKQPELDSVTAPVLTELQPAPDVPVKVCAGGDVMLGSNLDSAWTARAARRLGHPVEWLPDAGRLIAPLRSLVADADLVLLNVEGAIGEGPAPRKCRPGSTACYAFRQPPSAARALRDLAPTAEVIGNLANNHALDAGYEGLRATRSHLGAAGVHVTGLDTLPSLVMTAAGDTVAFLGFSTAQAGPDPRRLDAVARHVTRAKAMTPRVVLTMHMGAEGRTAQRTRDTTEIFLGEDRGNVVAFARAAVQAGASLVLGHGPHVMRAAEWSGDALIFYSLGNLLTYGPFSLAEPLNRGAIACAVLDGEGRVTSAGLRSTWQVPPGLVRPDPTGRAAWLVDSLSRLDFPETGARLISEAIIRRVN